MQTSISAALWSAQQNVELDASRNDIYEYLSARGWRERNGILMYVPWEFMYIQFSLLLLLFVNVVRSVTICFRNPRCGELTRLETSVHKSSECISMQSVHIGVRLYMKHTMCLIHLHLRRYAGYADGNDEIPSPWTLRYVIGLDTRVLKVTLYRGRNQGVIRYTSPALRGGVKILFLYYPA